MGILNYMLIRMNDESCLTDFNQFRKIVWDNAENDTAKAILFKIYFKESKDINYINKLLHLCSNECMNNHIFASQLHREKTMQIMWDKAKTKKSK